MVDVVDGKARENKKKERLKSLVNLTCQVFGEEQVIKPFSPATDFYVKLKLNIYPDKNEIEVLLKKDLLLAVNLAKGYERLEGSWTVVTLY